MDFDLFKKNIDQLILNSPGLEINEVQSPSSLGILFEKINLAQSKRNHLLIASPKDLEKITAFFLVKPPPFSWRILPPFPLNNSLFSEKIWGERIKWLSWAQHSFSGSLFLASPLSLLKKTSLGQGLHVIKPGTRLIDFASWGYKPAPFITKVGDFSSRGFLVDIYSPAYSSAIRLELKDDRVESLHLLSRDFKKREAELKEALIPSLIKWNLQGEERKFLCRILKQNFSKEDLPFKEDLIQKISRGEYPLGLEAFLDAKASTCSLDFFKEQPCIWMFNPEETKQDFNKVLESIQEDHVLFKKQYLFQPWEDLLPKIQISVRGSELPAQNSETQNQFIFSSSLVKKPKDLNKFLEEIEATSFVFVSQNEKAASQFKKSISLKEDAAFFQDKTFLFCSGNLKESFFSEEGVAYLQIEHLLPHNKTAAKISTFEFFKQRSLSLEFSQLQEGDLVVHRQHGVAQFDGLKTLTAQGQTQDFFVLLYQKGDKLFVPAHRAKEIKKYSRKRQDKMSKHLLDRLGDPRRWDTKKSQAKKHIQSIVVDLINLYRKRKGSFREPFLPVTESLDRFKQDFPFEETISQKKVIEEVLADMNESHPMDRLLCADVGFGKTEVALRASLRALENNFQVCFLAPTTILSLQHYENFKKRFKNWPYQIRLLNRFNSEKERKKIFQEAQEGQVDLLIATHSVFSPELFFKNLGLLVVDEEHRFGVKQKERLLRFKPNLDTLSLSATPIPRTLNMAMSGVKDISVLSQAPANRKPVKTFLKAWDEGLDNLIVESCKFERDRGGQILFVHNRIKTITQRLEHLQELLPEFKIECIHGNMPTSLLEKKMVDFFEKKVDLLLSTNIIESGMDIPQANTIFIDRVHHMGLSQIYQLKGRVGRSETQAYCYFLIPRKEGLSPIAKERLSLLEKHQSLGAGFQLALHDLETRGAGAFFGAEQSGHLHALGEDLFFEILNENLENQKEGFVDPEIQIPISIGIPETYIPDSKLRLLYYKSLSESEKLAQLDYLKTDLLDSFGPLPKDLENLFAVLKMKNLCKELLIKDLRATTTSLLLTFHPKTKISTEKIFFLLETKNWQMKTEHALSIPLEKTELLPQIEACLKELN